jgi:pyruvate/2-oxoglutarate dehydrogenase complex dihydrolipoamide acyltransferase (E2) component
MKQQHHDYQVVPYPKIRRWLALTYRSVQHRPMIHGLLEVDVTGARARLREHHAQTGESLSFTAFLMACLGKAVDEHKAVQAMRLGRKQLILFESVDVMTFLERDMHGQKQAIPCTVRAVNRKTVREIHQEIRAAQGQEVAQAMKGFKALLILPIWLSRFLFWLLGRSPRVVKKYWGTVTMTAVGMFGEGAGWGIPIAGTLMMTVGGIGQKPGVVDGSIAIREYLSLTISFDHDIVDGAPAARFTERLKELIESGYGLPNSTEEPELAAAPGTARKREAAQPQ